MNEKPTNPVRGFFMLGLMLGAAVGAAIGLLYAPRPGAESRLEMAEWAESKTGHGDGADPGDEVDEMAGQPGQGRGGPL